MASATVYYIVKNKATGEVSTYLRNGVGNAVTIEKVVANHSLYVETAPTNASIQFTYLAAAVIDEKTNKIVYLWDHINGEREV